MIIYVKKSCLRTDRQTDGQPKTIVRNLTKPHKSIVLFLSLNYISKFETDFVEMKLLTFDE